MVKTIKNTIPFLCEMCIYGKWEVVVEKKPIFATSFILHDVKKLAMYCKDKMHYIEKRTIPLHTCNFKPKSGRIGNGKIYQKTLFE